MTAILEYIRNFMGGGYYDASAYSYSPAYQAPTADTGQQNRNEYIEPIEERPEELDIKEELPITMTEIFNNMGMQNAGDSDSRARNVFLRKHSTVKASQFHKHIDPKSYLKQNSMIACYSTSPVVLAMDVSASMGNWPGILCEKIINFCGQIRKEYYSDEPAVSICAIGDALTDVAPLQVTKFGQGAEIRELLSKVWMEKGGGGNQRESYEFAAYFYNHFVSLQKNALPFFFIVGDEGFFPQSHPDVMKKVFGRDLPSMNVKEEWERLKATYNVFMLRKPNQDLNVEMRVFKQWVAALGVQRVLTINNSRNILDAMLGAVCLTSGRRNLDSYLEDIRKRENQKERLDQARECLEPYWNALVNGSIRPVGVIPKE